MSVTGSHPAERPRVLFVDDEPEVTAALTSMLRRSPYDVVVASSGADALRILDEKPVDVVVSDLDMPDMGGRELLARIRSAHPKAMRVVLSGHPRLDETIRVINDAGVFRFLLKPCSPVELGQCLEEAVAAKRARPATTPPDPGDDLFTSALESLWVATQPIVSFSERRVVGFEALVRTREPSLPHGGAVIELAERVGKVREIERRVRRVAASVASELPAGAMLLVNLHPSALDDPDLVDEAAPLAAFADRVVFEITERAKLETAGPAWDAVRALRRRGHRVAIDDLGAGYAGLTSLVTLQPEIIKLDMELVRDVDTSPTRSKLVAALVALARQLDVRVIAEGVESVAECSHLASLGCDWMQGYLFARPAPPFPDVRWPAPAAL